MEYRAIKYVYKYKYVKLMNLEIHLDTKCTLHTEMILVHDLGI